MTRPLARSFAGQSYTAFPSCVSSRITASRRYPSGPAIAYPFFIARRSCYSVSYGPDDPPAIGYEGVLYPSQKIPPAFQRYPQIFCPSSENRLNWNEYSLNGTEGMASILLRNVPMRFATACVHHLDLLRLLPDTALRCYACVISFLSCIEIGLLSWKAQRYR